MTVDAKEFPGYLRQVAELRGPTKTEIIAKALTRAAALLEDQAARTRDIAAIIEMLGKRNGELSDENTRLRATLTVLRMWGVAIQEEQFSYRPKDHIETIDRALRNHEQNGPRKEG